MASDLGVGFAKTSGKARHKWQFRMMRLRNSKPSTYRASFQALVATDLALIDCWTDLWDNILGYLTSRGIESGELLGAVDPKSADAYQEIVAGGKVPYNLWSGQPLDGMTALQAKELALLARKFRCRFELLFVQAGNLVDLANLSLPGQGDGHEGGAVNDPPVTD